MRRRGEFNPKRQVRPVDKADRTMLNRLARVVKYGGNPEHKSDPGDFGLTPPATPKPDKTLCDLAGVRARRVALSLLRSGIGKGLISRQERNGFPKNIWAVDEHDFAFEAQLENPAAGVYHGYPLPSADPFSVEVMRLWKERP
jgi:hypothetical protein